MTNNDTFDQEIARKQARAEPFAIATVVRTLAATAAKPGAKALLDENGAIIAGFLGGGCVRGAIGRAAVEAIESGAPRLISLKPQDLLDADGIARRGARGHQIRPQWLSEPWINGYFRGTCLAKTSTGYLRSIRSGAFAGGIDQRF